MGKLTRSDGQKYGANAGMDRPSRGWLGPQDDDAPAAVLIANRGAGGYPCRTSPEAPHRQPLQAADRSMVCVGNPEQDGSQGEHRAQ
jgi:hypothetical protein